jgi:putative addiction module component (TIGR02574 family)
MATQPIIESFRKLSSSEKIRLVQELWDEIAEEAARMPLSESHRRLLDQRLQQHEENPDDVEPWEKTRDDVLREL